MVNVVWVTETSEEYYQDYEEFIRLYNENKINVNELCETLNLSQGKYKQYRKRGFEENRLIPNRRCIRRTYNNNGREGIGKYYRKTSQGFIITKRIDGKNFSYGTYDDEELTQKIIQELKKVNWNKKYLPYIQHRLAEESLA